MRRGSSAAPGEEEVEAAGGHERGGGGSGVGGGSGGNDADAADDGAAISLFVCVLGATNQGGLARTESAAGRAPPERELARAVAQKVGGLLGRALVETNLMSDSGVGVWTRSALLADALLYGAIR